MALPNSFGAASTIASVWWDQNYGALGSVSAIQCSVSGVTSLALTPLANNPVPSYGNYQPFFGIAVSTNNGGVTASIGGSTALIVYKDTMAGPVTCTGGEIHALNAFMLWYDSALSSGAGGFHLRTGAATEITGQPISVSSISIGGGPPMTHVVSSLASIVFTAINPQSASIASVVLTGAKQLDNCNVGYSTVSTGIVYDGFISTANTFVVKASNITSGTVTPSGGIYRLTASGFT